MSARRTVALVGLTAQVVFTLAWLIAPLWQGPGYSVVAHSISDMYADTAPGGIVLVVVFTLCGIATVLFALLALLPTIGGAVGTTAAILIALSIFGLGDVLSPFERLGCRLADPGCTPEAQVATAGGTLDGILSTIGIMLAIAAGVLLVVVFARDSSRRPWMVGAIVTTALLFALFVLAGVLPPIGGLLERGIALVGAAGIAALAIGVMRGGLTPSTR